ncbi:F-box associated interaction domain [Arabidopsis thaliana x Arabidopsis arenosa]|uniref:F-box associated interaction domain n=1 Tax=Arabidopsis thaliana x Arabidopsis arenosa TaxID=1240361 RepID=A0A8T2A400_9BRAS|nr:F-box associated interaction domain [Arabidopsis thaliana x Arabidopsis arenosa]
MEREGNSDPIPIDIILDILSRSSTKEIATFGLASKLCASILNSQDFTELFLTRSLTSQPRLLFAIKNSGDWRFYSSPQLHNPDENHSLVVSADLHMQLPGDMGSEICGPVSGLFYFPNMRRSEVPVICEGVCIDGVLYYIAGQAKGVKLACFDVRNENFSWRWDSYDYGEARCELRLCLQILEDAQDQKWLKRRYTFPVNIVVKGDVSVVGVTATNEIILSMDYTSKAFFVFYFNPERSTLERVRVQGFEAFEKPNRVYTFVDYAEDFKFITESS